MPYCRKPLTHKPETSEEKNYGEEKLETLSKNLFGEKAAKSEGDQTTCCERELRRLMEKGAYFEQTDIQQTPGITRVVDVVANYLQQIASGFRDETD